jgi:hypothetical protein
MIATDFGHVGDLGDGQPLGLARRLELFAYCCHMRAFVTVFPRRRKGAVGQFGFLNSRRKN